MKKKHAVVLLIAFFNDRFLVQQFIYFLQRNESRHDYPMAIN